MENTESSSRKRSPCDPGDCSSPPKRGRVECRTMAGFTDDHHEELGLDLTLRLGLSSTTQNQRVQFQAPAVEDEITKAYAIHRPLEEVRAELAEAEKKNLLLKEMLSEATTENDELRDRISTLLFEGRNKQANQATDKGEEDEDRPSSSSNLDQAERNMKKPQVSLRIRTDKPMTMDGCLWKKYGQKMLGSVFPRAYYRCSLMKDCSVRKKVQRCAEDPTVWITTYWGSHDHLLPDDAVATASGTSEAMSMLLSGSLSSTNYGSISRDSFLAGATISAIDPFPSVMVDFTRPPPDVDRMSELTRTIFSDPEFNAALVAAVTASSRVLGADGDGQGDGKETVQ
ncbi:hypothetical protein ZIOFF_054420 [Zingiber officinale]|uniref:WRKY domain-containing protein n=1 Tax=Zingiber officinale TaxID=94328 RepID=A0A8J5KR58_ZINOF|nr:hypothetical protein ZIOFF_054420 [Zingiber officinale]